VGLSVLTRPATTLLSTLQRVKDELDITETSHDDVLLDILGRASSAVTQECGRPAFGVATYQETLEGSDSRLLGLSAVPVLAVSQVLEDTEALDPTDVTEGFAIEDAGAGVLYRAAGWHRSPSLLMWGAQVSASGYVLPSATLLRYTVTYTAGYLLPAQADYLTYDPTAGNGVSQRADPPPLPGAIEQACLHTAKAWFLARGRDDSVRRGMLGDQAIQYAPEGPALPGALPTVALGLLRDYRRVA
jgi:hypothetical protein